MSDRLTRRDVVGRDGAGFLYVKEADGSVSKYREYVQGNHVWAEKVVVDTSVDQRGGEQERVPVAQRWGMTDQAMTGDIS